MTEEKPVITIGLDGATWNLLDPWIQAGELPNLAEIRSESISAELLSCRPPVTSPNWKCYSTGKNPGKLGVYWWEIVDVANREITIPNSESFNSSEIWDYLGESDKQWAAVNMPTTFPPHGGDNGGLMISGGTTSLSEDYTSPESLREEIEQKFDYKPSPELPSDAPGSMDEICTLIESRFTVANWLLEQRELDFLHLTVFLSNKLHHNYWDDERTLRGWKLIDEKLDQFIDQGYDIVFMSDHGSNEIETEFQMNTWLEREGYLVRSNGESQAQNTAANLGLTSFRLSELAAKLGVRDFLRKIVPQTVVNQLPQGGYKKSEKLEVIDWEQTDAIASGQGLVYLTEPDAPDADQLRTELKEKIATLTDPRTGRQIATDVFETEDVYSGDYLHLAPDIVFDQGKGIHTEDLVGAPEVFSSPSGWRGENERNGIFMAYGPSFDTESTVEEPRIIDLMPTILTLLEEPIPDDIDGEPLNIFADIDLSSVTHRSPLETPKRGNEERNDVEKRLQELGYLN